MLGKLLCIVKCCIAFIFIISMYMFKENKSENEKIRGEVFFVHKHQQSLEVVISQRTGRCVVSGEKELGN